MLNEQWIDQIDIGGKTYKYYSLKKIEEEKGSLARLPKTIKILIENTLRHLDQKKITDEHLTTLLNWGSKDENKEVAFMPSRIVLQDFTGVPAVVDLAAMRQAVDREGKDARLINPQVPVDLVIDHSVMVDYYGEKIALQLNTKKEFERNQERYRFLKWAQNAFENFRVLPPSTGIIHQVNLEYLATVVAGKEIDGQEVIFPDTLVGTDSHTTMIGGLGVVGWGVGGIEAEAGMLGQPLYFISPEVVGVKLVGSLPEGATATDLTLRITQMLRQEKVVGKFVEYFGEGVGKLSLPDRATISNMCPEYGATVGYFPVDEETLSYMRLTGRSESQIELVKAYLEKQGLFGNSIEDEIAYSKVITLDLSTVKAALAGPKRPQDRIELDDVKDSFETIATTPVQSGGYGLSMDDLNAHTILEGKDQQLSNGDVVLAAITSCTNTSNPAVMLGAGLIAKKAVELGLKVPSYVKTSLTPGSKVVTKYLEKADVLSSLERLGFTVAGYGCATCIGNSGPLDEDVTKAIIDSDLVVGSVLSGNRNFEGRIHPHIKANYLASPMLVVMYALAGTLRIDFDKDPIGQGKDGQDIYFKDLWPSQEVLNQTMAQAIEETMFKENYKDIYSSNEDWNRIEAPTGTLYEWEGNSTYIREPDFFMDLKKKEKADDIVGARALLYLGDSITTDHISPAGSIATDSPAAKYLMDMGIEPKDFNSYGSRRGNHEVMMRGTFANIRIRNKLANGIEGGFTKMYNEDDIIPVYDAAMRYKEQDIPLLVVAGKEYGTGSSRDWAAKGPRLLGVKVVIAESYERIHRSNLVGMGILPLQFVDGQSAQSLGIEGDESYSILGMKELKPSGKLIVEAKKKDGSKIRFNTLVRLDSQVDMDYFLKEGILQSVLLDM